MTNKESSGHARTHASANMFSSVILNEVKDLSLVGCKQPTPHGGAMNRPLQAGDAIRPYET